VWLLFQPEQLAVPTHNTPKHRHIAGCIMANATALGATTTTTTSNKMLWTGRVISALPVLMLLMSAGMKLSHSPSFVEKWTKFGYPEQLLSTIGVLELLCAALYAIPRTTFLGAILVTAYLGGAVNTHVRVGDPFVIPIVLGVLVWLGLYFRNAHVRALSLSLIGK
jgi:hypothetical protein